MIRSLKGSTPIVHSSAYVSEAAYLVGEVEIGENSSIWPGAVLRGDTGKIVVGKNTNIQDNSVVHADNGAHIGDGVTLGHGVVCHARSVGANSLLGNGCTVNDGAEIGEGSIIASGAVVLEEVKIPPGSLVVGIPAKVLGPTTARHREMIQSTGEHYVQRGREYKAEGLE